MIVPYETEQLTASSILIHDPVLHVFAMRVALLTAIVCRCLDRSLTIANGLLATMKVCWITLNDMAREAAAACNSNDGAAAASAPSFSAAMLRQLLESFTADVVKTSLEEFAAVHVDEVKAITHLDDAWVPPLGFGAEEYRTLVVHDSLPFPRTLGWYMDYSCGIECSAELAKLFSRYEVTGIVRDELNNTPPESGIFTIAISPRTTFVQCQHGFPCFGCSALIFARKSGGPQATPLLGDESTTVAGDDDDPRLWTIFPRHCSNHEGLRHHSFHTNKLIGASRVSSFGVPLNASRIELSSSCNAAVLENNMSEREEPFSIVTTPEERTFCEIRLRLLFWVGNGSRLRDFASIPVPDDDVDDGDGVEENIAVSIPFFCLYLPIGEVHLVVQRSRRVERILRGSAIHILPVCVDEDRKSTVAVGNDAAMCTIHECSSEGLMTKIVHRLLNHSRPVCGVLQDRNMGNLRGSAFLTLADAGRFVSVRATVLPHLWVLHTRFTLLFDLDRTLVDNSITSGDYCTAKSISYAHSNGFIVTETVFLRNGVRELLHQLASIWQLRCVLATKSSRNRAQAVVQQLLDPTGAYFSGRLFCMEDLMVSDDDDDDRNVPTAPAALPKKAEAVLKKFRIDGDVEDVVIIDDAPQAWDADDWGRVVAVHPYALAHRDPPNYFFPTGEVGQQILYRLIRLGEISRERPSPLTPIFPSSSGNNYTVHVEEGNHFDAPSTGSSWSIGAEEVVLQ